MEWTREKTLALINEYRKRRELWDMTHDDYRKKEMKQKFLTEVSNCLGGNIPIVEVEKKFHTLRTQYHREINRIKRKDAYNSKWFAFKNLQFLSSPKACRSNKGRIKSEITEDGTVTTKYIISESVAHDNGSGGSLNSSISNLPDEFLTIHRKPTTITYETTTTASGNVAGGNIVPAPSSSRSHELEKLIEETTKDVEDIEEAKPKVTIKEIKVAADQGHSYAQQLRGAASEIAEHSEQLHQESHHQQEHGLDGGEGVVEPIESIEIQDADGEITYHPASSTQTATIHHPHGLPTHIFKIQRRDTVSGGHDEGYYEHHHNQQQTTKRIYYDANSHTATILTPTTSTTQGSGALLPPPTKMHRSNITSSQQLSPTSSPTQLPRDEFNTYGEYVANEMRSITNREVLTALKHKINTALFEANMAELQK